MKYITFDENVNNRVEIVSILETKLSAKTFSDKK